MLCCCFHWLDRYLRADVAITCGTPDHAAAQAAALLAILLYPLGLLLFFGLLLMLARSAIVADKPTRLSTAVAFLHREYEPIMFWWELMEMARRVVLVGVFVVLPWDLQGSIEQLAYGTMVTLVYLTVQITASPYRNPSDDFFATGCSLAIAMFFLCSLIFKYTELTQVVYLQERMSSEQVRQL